VDNTGNNATGETRVGLVYQHANVLGLDHVASLVYTTSPDQPNNVSIYGAGYHIPLYRSGDSIDLYAAHSNVDAGTVSAGGFGLQVSGKGSASGIRYNQNLGSARGIESKLAYGLDYRAYEDDAALSGVPIGSDVTVHPVSLTYLAKWTPAAAEMVAYMGAAANVPGGKNGSDADFERVRTGASADYTLLRYGASYRQGLPRDWQMYLNLSGQYTRDLLIPGEQFAVGGATPRCAVFRSAKSRATWVTSTTPSCSRLICARASNAPTRTVGPWCSSMAHVSGATSRCPAKIRARRSAVSESECVCRSIAT
jgi:hemolysin activation/secretion protein